MMERAHAALAASTYPKLLFAAEPGALVPPAFAEELAGKLKDCRFVKLGDGIHFLQEDHPETIGRSVAAFIAEVEGRKGQERGLGWGLSGGVAPLSYGRGVGGSATVAVVLRAREARHLRTESSSTSSSGRHSPSEGRAFFERPIAPPSPGGRRKIAASPRHRISEGFRKPDARMAGWKIIEPAELPIAEPLVKLRRLKRERVEIGARGSPALARPLPRRP